MNLNLDAVVSDITGATGKNIILALLNGERDPLVLAKLRDSRCKRSEQEIAQRQNQANRQSCRCCIAHGGAELVEFTQRARRFLPKKALSTGSGQSHYCYRTQACPDHLCVAEQRR